jgi:hypothetical protein
VESSGRVRSPPVFDLFTKADSMPPFGSEVDKNGDMPDRGGAFFGPATTTDSEELVFSAAAGLPARPWWTELLLRGLGSLSSALFLEKKLLFEAVMGVLGVLAICLVGGGLRCRSVKPWSWSAAILAAVGVLRGPRVMGGNRRGCRLFLLA